MDTDAVSDTLGSKLVIDVVNSTHFRVVVADEISIGISPSGMINLDFANDRESPARRITYMYDTNGDLKNTQTESDADIIREVEFSVMMSRRTATELRDRLVSLLNDEDDENIVLDSTP